MKFEELKKVGKVESVDTSNVIVKVVKEELLNNLQVNNYFVYSSTN